MFKSMLKRTWLSVSRKPGRSIVLGLILFVMANLVLATIVIKGSVNESVDYAKRSLGGTVYLSIDMSSLRERMTPPTEADVSSESVPTVNRQQITRPSIYVDMVESIAESDYVRDYTYSLSTSANSSDLVAIESETAGVGGFGGMMGGRGEGGENFVVGDFTISAVNSYAFISEVENNTMSLSSGNYFDETTDNQIIISYDLAVENGLEVGDSISLTNIYSEENHSLEIIGIYDVTSEMFSVNTVYMNPKTATAFLSEEDLNDGNYSVSNVKYFMNNAENVDDFISEAKGKYPNLSDDNLTLDIDTTAYDQMVGPIEQVGSFANIILVVVIVAAVLIIALIINSNIKNRRYEIGVLMSLGASKKNVIGQIMAELLLVGTIGFALSIGTSTFLAKAMSQGLIDSQISASEESSETNFGRPTVSMGGGQMGGRFSGAPGQPGNDVDVIDSVDINAQLSDYVLLFVLGYLVIIVAMIVPTMNITKYEPKSILTGRE